MPATAWLIRRRLRRQWLALVPVGLIVMLGATGAFVALGAADRTSNAYSRYLERADVGDVVINPSLSTTEIDEVIRTLPGVRSVRRDALFQATLGDEGPQTVGESFVESAALQVRGSRDGRYTTVDRPALTEGRLPTGRNEALVNEEIADARDVDVGDVVSVSFGRTNTDFLLDPATVNTPLGVEHLTVVGVATLADEVLPDGVYPRQRVIVSPDVAARYDCLPDVPPANVTLEEALDALLPPDCSTSYSYYSLEIEGGAGGVAAAFDTVLRRAAELNADLPQAVPDNEGGYIAFATTTAQEQQRVERSTRPTVAALAVLGVAAAAITVIVLGLMVARELRRTVVEQRQWWHLGMTTSHRAVVVLVPLFVAVAAGLVAAFVLAWLLSPVAPVGLVRSIEPSPARELSSWVGLGALALGAIFAAGSTALALQATRRVQRRPVRNRDLSVVRRLVRGSDRPAIDEGIRAAYGGNRGAGLVAAGGAVAAALFLAASVFSASLSAVLSTPASYGWPWHVGLMGGFGYGGVDLEAARTKLDAREDIERWTGLGFTNTVTVDGEGVLAVIGVHPASDAYLTVVDGELPRRENHVALGRQTAADLGVGVGDEVELGGEELLAVPRATVTGVVVLPALGPLLADRTGPGTGIVLPASAFEDGAAAIAFSFVGVDLVPGAGVEPLLADLRDDFPAWEPFGEPAVEFVTPVRPPEILNAESMRAVPLLVGGLLMATALVGLLVAVVVSVRARRRELAVLRVLGFTGRQLRDSVRVQTVATMIGALVIGVPLGIVVGRVVWRLFADELGVVNNPSTPGLWIVGAIAGALVVGVVAAAVPARVAARTRPAVALRSE